MDDFPKVFFAPQLYIRSGVREIGFYQKAFGAEQTMRRTNNDGTVHVAEFSIGDQIFHLHEDTTKAGLFSPEKISGTTVKIGLFVSDVDEVMNKAMEAGAKIISPARDYDYGYRQGELIDPFGHRWLIQKKITDGRSV
jgi:PhnB protein